MHLVLERVFSGTLSSTLLNNSLLERGEAKRKDPGLCDCCEACSKPATGDRQSLPHRS